MADLFSNVQQREKGEWKKVKITSPNKPEVTSETIKKWQKLIDNAAQIIDVPSGLIMRLQEKTIKVFIKSNTKGNPYKIDEEAKLIYGLYCETVIGTQDKLIVPNARGDEVWKSNNPDVDIGMISYMGVPLNWPDGDVFGTVCVLDNKTNSYNELYADFLQTVKQNLEKDLEILLHQKEIEKQNKELKYANEVKSKFLSLISHDIRTSIGSIKEYFTFLLSDFDHFDKDNLHDYLLSLDKSVNVTYEMLENLLLWSKNELLKLPVSKEKINLAGLLKNLAKKFESAAKLKNINLVTQMIDEDVYIHADKTMIETAIRNILSNAVKFTETDGSISIILNRSQNNIIIEIVDNGIGIPRNILDILFSYDESIRRKGTEGETSSGIGLFLIKEFVEKNDGSISINSKPGQGTTVKLTF